MIRDPFATPGCTCSTIAGLAALLEERDPPPPCEFHQPGEAAKREQQRERDEHLSHAEQLQRIIDEQKAGDELERRRAAKARGDADRAAGITRLSETDPLLASIYSLTDAPLPTSAPGGSHVPLGGPLSSYRSLAGFTEVTDHRNFDGPDAA